MDLDRIISVLERAREFTEECFDDAKYCSDIDINEQDEYKDLVDLLRDLHIQKQNIDG